MLQRSRSKAISKAKYFIVIPVILVMLTMVACSEDKIEMTEEKSLVKQIEELKAAIEDKENLTVDEVYHLNSLQKDYSNKIEIIEVVEDDNNPSTPPSPGTKYSGLTEVVLEENSGTADVPFAVVEQVPVYPGCEDASSNDAKKECMSNKVQEFVQANFDTSLGKKLGLKGVNRVIVVFKISPEGNITDIRSRAPHSDLEIEAKRVIEGLPKMIPGEHNGQKIAVSYSLPIVFQVNE